MVKSILELKGQGRTDNFQTPDWPIELLINAIGKEKFKDKTVWEPACGKGNIVKCLNKHGINTFGTDLLEVYDFLNWQPALTEMLNFNKKSDFIITNPPFSKKTEFLKRCYELQKPFALLLPYSTFETKERQELFKKHGVQVLFLPRRVDFEYPDGNFKKSPWFATCWITNGFKFEKDMVFL